MLGLKHMPERLVDSVMDGTAFAASDLIAEANHRIANDLGIIVGLIRVQVLKIPLDSPREPLHAMPPPRQRGWSRGSSSSARGG